MNERKIRVSVALCTYNGTHFVHAQLASILAQTRLPDELVICDDHSNDDTLGIIYRIIANVPFPVVVKCNHVRLGPTKNFEQAISLCTGDVITLCDQDDVWIPEKLAKVEQAFYEHPDAGYVFSDALVVDEKLCTLGYTMWQTIGFSRKEQRRFNSGYQLKTLLRRNVVTGATLAFRAELRDAVLPIPQEWIHDAWIALIATCCGKKGFAIDTPLILYRQHKGQAVGGRKLNLKERIARACATQREEYLLDILRYKRVQERLEFLGINDVRVTKLLEEKISHLGARAKVWDLPKARAFLAPLEELVSGRYWRFSNGWLSFGKDFLVAIGRGRKLPSS